MNSDPEYDIHPLDRDYSEPPPAERKRELSSQERIRRFGVIIFAGGLAVVVLAAIALGVFRGSGPIEGFGSAMHRFGMIAILVGGVMIVTSYRLSALSAGLSGKGTGFRVSLGSFALLVLINAIAYALLAGLSTLRSVNGSPIFLAMLYQALITCVCGLLVTMIVWHRGMLRAYAIGALIALVVNIFGFQMVLSMGMPSRAYSQFYLGSLASIPITGLFCAGYVTLLFPTEKKSDEPENTGVTGKLCRSEEDPPGSSG